MIVLMNLFHLILAVKGTDVLEITRKMLTVVQLCIPLTLQADGSILGTAPPLERHNKGSPTLLIFYASAIPALCPDNHNFTFTVCKLMVIQ